MIYKSIIVVILVAVLSYVALGGRVFSHVPTYVTWDGLEPDKWAAVWLIKKQISPDSKIEIRPIHARTDDGIAFDVPGAKFYRNSERSTYASLLIEYQSRADFADPAILKIGDIIQDMDVNVWADKTLPETPILENALRTLQQNYNRTSVPPECYSALFDSVYLSLTSEIELSDTTLTQVVNSCSDQDASSLISRNESLVTEVPVTEVLSQINAGKKVIFVDTRESEEFSEMHIPGAINIKLRDVNEKISPILEDADLIISYCVKDFRGYEVAKAIGDLGIKNSSIMVPYGVRGWNDLGLPVFAQDGLGENEAQIKLKQCASSPSECLDIVAL